MKDFYHEQYNTAGVRLEEEAHGTSFRFLAMFAVLGSRSPLSRRPSTA